MQWYQITFDHTQVKEGRSVEFLRQFGECLSDLRFPTGLALFRNRRPSDTYGSVYYLPPGADKLCEGLIESYQATNVPKPRLSDIDLTVGPKGSADFWYRNSDDERK